MLIAGTVIPKEFENHHLLRVMILKRMVKLLSGSLEKPYPGSCLGSGCLFPLLLSVTYGATRLLFRNRALSTTADQRANENNLKVWAP